MSAENRLPIGQKTWVGLLGRWAPCVTVALAFGGACIVSTPPQQSLAPIDEAKQRRLHAGSTRVEPAWEDMARAEFPGDPWSQGDHFHNLEANYVSAAAHGPNKIQDILLAVDEGVRNRWPSHEKNRRQIAPCRPRPFYD